MKKLFFCPAQRQQGSALIIALLILVFLTTIGISATTTSEIEILVAGNEAFHKIAFYHADSGVYSTPKIIRQCMGEGRQPDFSEIEYLDSGSDDFYRELMGYRPHDTDRDIQYTLSGHRVQVDVERTRHEALEGGGAEFGSGLGGIGVGSTGGVAIYYAMNSLGEGPGKAESAVLAEYRFIPGIAGGL
jgi:hypothetical protein